MTHDPSGMTKSSFLKSDKAIELRAELEMMVKSPLYNTRIVTLVSDDLSFFVEKHMQYMSNHLKMDHSQYVKNLKLMTKIRQ